MRSYGMDFKYGNFDYKYLSSNYRMNELEAVVGYHHLTNYSKYLKRKKPERLMALAKKLKLKVKD